MASNTLDIVHPNDSDYSDYQYEGQNLAQQVIHFVDNINVPSSDNESLNNYSSDNESVDSENSQNGNGNCIQIPISNYEQDTEQETDFEMGWEWILHLDPHHFFEALFEAEMWNHIARETNKYAETRITQRCK